MNNKYREQRITIIVVTKDNPLELAKTLDSIFAQNYNDGAEVLIIESWHDLDHLKVIITGYTDICYSWGMRTIRQWPALGIYPAMNKGIDEAKGDCLMFLNSGDTFADENSLSSIMKFRDTCLEHNKQFNQGLTACIFGQARMNLWRTGISWVTPYTDEKGISTWLRGAWPCHQSMIFESQWAKKNKYCEDKGISADKQIMRRALRSSNEIYFLKQPIVHYSLKGISTGPLTLVQLSRALRKWKVDKVTKVVMICKYLLCPVPAVYPLFLMIKAMAYGKVISLLSQTRLF